MPLRAQRLDHRIHNRLPALPALGRVPIRMAPNAPRIPIFLNKRRRRIKRVAALRAEKVSDVPLRAACDNNLALDGRLAALAARREQLVEVKVAEEALGFVEAVVGFQAQHVVGRGVRGEELDVLAALAGADAGDALGVLDVGLGVEGYTFQVLAAVVADEAFGVEARACGRDDAPRDGQRALAAEGTGADRGRGPVRLGASRAVSREGLGAVVRRIG